MGVTLMLFGLQQVNSSITIKLSLKLTKITFCLAIAGNYSKTFNDSYRLFTLGLNLVELYPTHNAHYKTNYHNQGS